MPLSIEEMNHWLKAGPFNAFLRARVTEANLDAQTLVMVMPRRDEFERIPQSGQWHGGPIGCLIDTAACFAVCMVQGHPVPTINFRVDYFRPAVQTDLTAKATVRRIGKTVAVADVDIFNDKGQLLAVGRGTFGSASG